MYTAQIMHMIGLPLCRSYSAHMGFLCNPVSLLLLYGVPPKTLVFEIQISHIALNSSDKYNIASNHLANVN